MENKYTTIGIIAAMDKEIDGIKAKLKDVKIETFSSVDFYIGYYNDIRVIAAKCGIGKVFSALCTEAMILKYNPDCVINTGVGGSLVSELKIFDVVIATSVVHHDLDTSPLGDPLGLISGINIINIETDKELSTLIDKAAKSCGINCKEGIIASGDQFISGAEKKQWISTTFNATVCEMEGASIGHVCYVNNTPFAIVRAISDSGDETDYNTFADKAAQNSINVMMAFLSNI